MIAVGGVGSALAGVVSSLVGGAASDLASPILSGIGAAISGAAAHMVTALATVWMRTPTPALTSGSDQTPSVSVAFIQGHVWWYMTAAAVVGVLVGCGRMAWEQRADAGRDVLRGLAVFVATTGAGLTVVALGTSAADAFATWIVAASGGSFATELGRLTNLANLAGSPVGGGLSGVILVMIFGLLLIVASLIQMVLMIVRGGMLVLLAGVLPLSAAFTSTQTGRQWFRRSCGWLVAFILYKPAAAIVYATAFTLAGNGSGGAGGVVNVITGLVLMVLAIVLLPALMKFVVPLVGATAAGGAGGVLAGVAGGAATGAMLGGPTGALRGVGSAGAASAGRGAAAGDTAGPVGSSGSPGGVRVAENPRFWWRRWRRDAEWVRRHAGTVRRWRRGELGDGRSGRGRGRGPSGAGSRLDGCLADEGF